MNRPLVVKVGGSLLDWPGLRDRLHAYLASRRTEWPVVLAGGGRAADLIRDLDRVHFLTPEVAHRLAVRSLDLTAHCLAALLAGSVVVESIDSLPSAWDAGRFPIFAPRSFLEEVDATTHDPLRASWEVTSDSIAARLATSLDARELALLKSAPLPPGSDRVEAARLGLVDPAFPEVARGLERVTYLNLRKPGDSAFWLPA